MIAAPPPDRGKASKIGERRAKPRFLQFNETKLKKNTMPTAKSDATTP